MTDSSVSSPAIRCTDLQLKQCPRCEYALEGLPAEHQCPECGYRYGAGTYVLAGRLNNPQSPMIAPVLMFGFALFNYWRGSQVGTIVMAFLGLIFLFMTIMTKSRRRLRSREQRLYGNKWQLLLCPAGIAISNGPAEPEIIPWREFAHYRLARHFDYQLTWARPLKPKHRLILTGEGDSIWGWPERRTTMLPERIDFIFDADADTAREIDRVIAQRLRPALKRPVDIKPTKPGVKSAAQPSNQPTPDA